MGYLKNRWYMAAWPEEVSRGLLARTILEQPVLLYRTGNGEPVAVQDRCPHRFVPLSAGTLVGDVVQCGYHGLRFDRAGSCVLNPHGDRKIPQGAGIASYPVVERHGMIWIWLGDGGRADPALIPDCFAFMGGPHTGFRTTHNYIHADYGADILIDNLMDLSHAEFLHEGSFSGGYAEDATMRAYDEGEDVRVDRFLRATQMPPFMAPLYDAGNEAVDHWQDFRWVSPGLIRYEFGVVHAGRPREQGVVLYATHVATPESRSKTHYFASISRHVSLDDGSADEAFRLMQRGPVETEDSPMLEKQQCAMGEADFWSLKPVFLQTDAGALRVRRKMERLIAHEKEEESAMPPELSTA